MEINVNENKKRAELYSKEKTFSFIDETLPDGEHHYHNGFIIEVNDVSIKFFDVVNKIEIPLSLEKCFIDVSKKRDLSPEIALEIMFEFYKNKEVEKKEVNEK